jgi:hypothetical protein
VTSQFATPVANCKTGRPICAGGRQKALVRQLAPLADLAGWLRLIAQGAMEEERPPAGTAIAISALPGFFTSGSLGGHSDDASEVRDIG